VEQPILRQPSLDSFRSVLSGPAERGEDDSDEELNLDKSSLVFLSGEIAKFKTVRRSQGRKVGKVSPYPNRSLETVFENIQKA
jgi:hypothetical protein